MREEFLSTKTTSGMSEPLVSKWKLPKLDFGQFLGGQSATAGSR